jgi:hypothetical protein
MKHGQAIERVESLRGRAEKVFGNSLECALCKAEHRSANRTPLGRRAWEECVMPWPHGKPVLSYRRREKHGSGNAVRDQDIERADARAMAP